MAAPEEPEGGSWQGGLREAGPYLGLGMQLALTIVVFTGAGLGVDLLVGSMPWGTIAGALLGMVAMFVQLMRVSKEMGRKNRRGPGTGGVKKPGV